MDAVRARIVAVAVRAEIGVVDARVLEQVRGVERAVDAPADDPLHAAIALQGADQLGIDELVRADHEDPARPARGRRLHQHAAFEVHSGERQGAADLAPAIAEAAGEAIHWLEEHGLPAALKLTVEARHLVAERAKRIRARFAKRNHVVAEEVTDEYAL